MRPSAFDLDLSKSTRFGRDFETTVANQNGYTAGSLVGVSIDEQGRVFGNYSNDESQQVGTIVLARFANAEGLKLCHSQESAPGSLPGARR